MFIYEVNLEIDDDVANAYLRWMPEHIKEILEIEGVLGAKFFDVETAHTRSGKVYATVQYEMKDRAAYESYIQNHAPRLREDVIKRFGGKFIATRRLLISRPL